MKVRQSDSPELSPYSLELAKRFKYFRKNVLKLTQKEMAEALDCGQPNVVKYEQGVTALSVSVLQALHKKFNISFEWLFTGLGKPNHTPEKRNLTTDLNQIKTNASMNESRLDKLEKQMITLTRELYALKHQQK